MIESLIHKKKTRREKQEKNRLVYLKASLSNKNNKKGKYENCVCGKIHSIYTRRKEKMKSEENFIDSSRMGLHEK